MNGNAEMLNFIYQNSQMGVETISQILDMVQDEGLKKQLEMQLSEYREINSEADKRLEQNGCEEKGLGSFEKIRTYLMINMQTMNDRSASHIAEMLIVGSNMGIIQAIRKLRRYDGAEESILRLMKRLLAFEEHNVEQLKDYL